MGIYLSNIIIPSTFSSHVLKLQQLYLLDFINFFRDALLGNRRHHQGRCLFFKVCPVTSFSTLSRSKPL